MFGLLQSIFSSIRGRKRGGRTTRKPDRQKTFRPILEALETREVPATLTAGIADWGPQVYAPYVNVEQPQTNGTPLNFAQAAQQAGTKYLTLGFITVDSKGKISWDGDTSAELGQPGLDQQLQAQVDNLRQAGGDVMISFGGEDDSSGQSTELAVYVAETMGTGPAAVNALVSDYQQVIAAYHLTHIDFDIEGDAVSNTASINLRSQALAQLQQNNPGLQVYFTLPGEVPQDANLVFGMTSQDQTLVNSALGAGVHLAGVNLMTMDFSNWCNYFDNTPANQSLYQQQLNPGNFPYAGNDPNQQGISNVADVVERNAQAEFAQLQQTFAAFNISETPAQVWAMVGITPEIGRNSTDEVDQGKAGNSNVIFSLTDAQTVETFAQGNGVGRISMWSLDRDQSGNPTDPAHSETNSSLVQNPFQFSQIFSAFATGGSETNSSGPTIITGATASSSSVTANSTKLSVVASDPSGVAGLTYTWTATGTVPAAVSFSTNGTNSSANTTVSFSQAGTYNFLVTVTDAAGLSTTSSVTVVVKQTMTGIAVKPATTTVGLGATDQFTATAVDQFGNAMTVQPAIKWSKASGAGTISATGLFKASTTPGSATVKATSGKFSGTATVSIGSSVQVSFADTDDWGTGFTGSITITNTGTTAINGWKLEFNFGVTIKPTQNVGIWDAIMVSHSGTRYTVKNASWDASIAPGESITFGFVASGVAGTGPFNYLFIG